MKDRNIRSNLLAQPWRSATARSQPSARAATARRSRMALGDNVGYIVDIMCKCTSAHIVATMLDCPFMKHILPARLMTLDVPVCLRIHNYELSTYECMHVCIYVPIYACSMHVGTRQVYECISE